MTIRRHSICLHDNGILIRIIIVVVVIVDVVILFVCHERTEEEDLITK